MHQFRSVALVSFVLAALPTTAIAISQRPTSSGVLGVTELFTID